MFVPFLILFNVLSVVAILLYHSQKENARPSTTPAYKKFQLEYLVPYLCMTMSDWLQGPYIFTLYDFYGYSMGEVGWLFIAGFASSLVMGTFVGGLADSLGRKRISLVFVILYILSCLLKHVNNFYYLLLGRIFGGIATSILHSVFESWLIYEHQARGFHPEWLPHTFSLASVGSSATAIFSGIVATLLILWTDDVKMPFNLSIIFLLIGGGIIYAKWTENYGSKVGNTLESFVKGYQKITQDSTILALGLAQGLFESTMYIFVFMWTPSLNLSEYFNGIVFAIFMVSVMIGSNAFNLLSSYYPIERIFFFQMLLAACALVIPILFSTAVPKLFSFILFEMCVGVFWPTISTLKSRHIPECSIHCFELLPSSNELDCNARTRKH